MFHGIFFFLSFFLSSKMALVSWQTFQRLGLTITGRLNGGRYMAAAHADTRFRSFFGCGPKVVTDLWYETNFTNAKTTPEHFLWGLLYMKVYASEEIMAMLAGCNRRTFRKWSWNCIFDMSDCSRRVVSIDISSSLLSSPPLANHLLFTVFRSSGRIGSSRALLVGASELVTPLLMGQIFEFRSQHHSRRSGTATSLKVLD